MTALTSERSNRITIDRELLEDLEECVRSGTRHSDAADAAWALLHPGAQL